MNSPVSPPIPNEDDPLDFGEIFRRLQRGLILTLGLGLVGLSAGLIINLVATSRQPAETTIRVTFAFPGFERGLYPNSAKFIPDDLRSPDIISDAIKNVGLPIDQNLVTRVRGAISISGVVSPAVMKERDRQRAAGQTLAPFFPDEYAVALSLPRDFPLSIRQREQLLTEIVNLYRDKFRRTYIDLPPDFGTAFSLLRNADFVEYELILNKELQSLITYLDQQSQHARSFRSPTNNLSFQDLLKQAELFAQIRLNDVLGVIYVNGLSKNREFALVKMDYYLRTLTDQEQRLQEEESVVTDLLAKTQERAQNYVLATKAQAKPDQPLLDQGFIDTLLANDAYNFLVRRALDAGLALKRVQADKTQLLERKKRMESFAKGETRDQDTAIASTQAALTKLESDYDLLLAKIRVTLADFSRQEYGDAIRISMQPRTESMFFGLLLGAGLGLATGLSLGVGLSLLNRHPGRAPA
jgi:hypothetical protein